MTIPTIVRDAATSEAVVSGTDVTVAQILEELKSAPGLAAVLTKYPELTEEAVRAAVAFAVAAVRRERSYAPEPMEAERWVVRERAVAYGAENDVAEEIARVDARIAELTDQIGLLQGVRKGLEDVQAGNVVPHDEVVARLRAVFSR